MSSNSIPRNSPLELGVKPKIVSEFNKIFAKDGEHFEASGSSANETGRSKVKKTYVLVQDYNRIKRRNRKLEYLLKKATENRAEDEEEIASNPERMATTLKRLRRIDDFSSWFSTQGVSNGQSYGNPVQPQRNQRECDCPCFCGKKPDEEASRYENLFNFNFVKRPIN